MRIFSTRHARWLSGHRHVADGRDPARHQRLEPRAARVDARLGLEGLSVRRAHDSASRAIARTELNVHVEEYSGASLST